MACPCTNHFPEALIACLDTLLLYTLSDKLVIHCGRLEQLDEIHQGFLWLSPLTRHITVVLNALVNHFWKGVCSQIKLSLDFKEKPKDTDYLLTMTQGYMPGQFP